MTKKFCAKTMSIILIILILVTNMVYAANKSDLNNQKNDLDSQIDKAKEDLDEVKEDKSEKISEVEKLTQEINKYENEIDDLNFQIGELNTSINEAQEKVDAATEEYGRQQDLMDKRLVSLYEAGETSYLDVLLSSGDITEFISNYYLVEEIASYDTELLKKIDKQKREIEAAKKQLEEDKQKIEVAQKAEKVKQDQVKAKKKEKASQVAKLSEDEKKIQQQLEQFEKDKKEIQNQIAEILRREAEEAKKNQNNNSSGGSSGGGNIANNPSKSGFIRPVAGYSITTGFYGYSGHTGVDFSGSNIYGKPVVAVKSGTVVTSKAISGNIPNYDTEGNVIGHYRSYGEYIVINHHDGTMTLYAHGKPGSRLVSPGQKVKQGQQIMSVGNTGNVQPRPTPSNPLGGKHLHFEVQILKNGRAVPVNPAPYLP